MDRPVNVSDSRPLEVGDLFVADNFVSLVLQDFPPHSNSARVVTHQRQSSVTWVHLVAGDRLHRRPDRDVVRL